MSVVSEIRLTVTRSINLGNYENVKIEGTVVVGRDDDKDTAKSLREQALEEVGELLAAAYDEHVPIRRRSGAKDE
jgi:hypothetical protein